MCGIAGWVDFERDLSFEQDTVRSMTATLANRGPDAEGVWTSRQAALGFRRLAVIDLPGGNQPMVAEHDGRELAVLVYNGEVYNFPEVRQRLVDLGHRFATASDTEVVLQAYLEWGAACVDHLEGMFAFAVWDPRERKLVLARDRLGIKPLFYARVGRGIVFGSEPKALLAHPLVRPVVHTEGMAELLAYIATPGRAVYRDIKELPAGHVLHVQDGAVAERRYWALPAREHTDDWDTTVETVRSLLQDSVRSHLNADVPLCTLLSGGLDSSAIAAFAGSAPGAIEAPRTFSVDFEGHEGRFREDFWHMDPDAPFAKEVSQHLGTNHEAVVLRNKDMIDPVVAAATLRAQDLPTPIPDMDRSLYLLLRAVRQQSTVALMGEVADELFGGYRSYQDPSLVASDNFPWVTMGFAVAKHGMGTGLFDPGTLDKIDVPTYSADRFRQALAEVPVLDGESERDRNMRAVSYVHLTRWLPLLLTRDDRLSMAVGLELRVPYCDHRLVEYVFNIPWSMHTADGREKSVLRSAVADLLPESVVQRRKSPFPITQDPDYGAVLRERFEAVVADSDSPVLPLLNVPAAKAILAEDRPIAVEGWGERRDVEMVLQTDDWLRQYGVRVEI